MSIPFVIWTFRRTGGTTLTDLMMDLSEHPRIDQEPFNWDRCFGAVSKHWFETRDTARLEADLDALLADTPLIKHCHELHPDGFNDALFAAAHRHGYRQLVLDRRDEVGRMLSLELAQMTGAWGKMGSAERYARVERGDDVLPPIDIPAALGHMRLCQARRHALRARIDAAGVPVPVVLFEDLYTCPIEEGRPRVRAILQDLGLTRNDPAGVRQRITQALRWRGQGSARILPFVPNLDAARDALAAEVAGWGDPVF
ncbi:MAG: hypothetical protein Q8K20_13785 [Gemmobacter sp.]|nr:hypothetical protein [Gemmobacter sp.]